MQRFKKFWSLVALLFLWLFGLVHFVDWVNDIQLMNNGIRTQGTVVGLEKTICGKSSATEFVVQFTDSEGRTETERIGTCGSLSVNLEYSVGSTLSIRYLADNPAVVELQDALVSQFWYHLIVGVPTLLGLLGEAALRVVRKLRRTSKPLQAEPDRMPKSGALL